jgi:putative transposase
MEGAQVPELKEFFDCEYRNIILDLRDVSLADRDAVRFLRGCERDGMKFEIIAILKEAEAGIAPDELCRRHGITRGSLYRWKAKYGGMEVSEARRLRQLEEENRQLKHAVAELLLDKRALQAVVTKKW